MTELERNSAGLPKTRKILRESIRWRFWRKEEEDEE